VTLEEFNAAPDDAVTAALLACCDVPRWAAAVRDHRPYDDVEALAAVADQAARELSGAEVDRALAAHPRIGERARGRATDAAWSRQEQSGVGSDDDLRRTLADANRAYEERFDRVFLICATGLTGEQILARLRLRLDNDPETEAAVVADELRKIAALRVRKLVHP